MGIPQTYLQFLSPLGDPESSGKVRTAITEALSDFELFCFVLIDPARDLNLHARLVSEWEQFDRYSGRHLLLFAPIDPLSGDCQRSPAALQEQPPSTATPTALVSCTEPALSRASRTGLPVLQREQPHTG